MVTTIATFALGALLAAFAVYAVMLNEGEHAARKRARRRARSGSEDARLVPLDLDATPSTRLDGRRMPVGDFLFGALYLRGEEPFPFAELATAASESGLDINQTLTWLARAEKSGLVERIAQAGDEGQQPAVRLSAEGMHRARNNRRGVRMSSRTSP
jgi:predicted Rossmann fold nucleotide-binding protein DprA/Smf involved in DNA uptake